MTTTADLVDRARAILDSGECPDCAAGAVHVCALLLLPIVEAAVDYLAERDSTMGPFWRTDANGYVVPFDTAESEGA